MVCKQGWVAAGLVSMVLLGAASLAHADCPLDRAVYRDAGQRGFTLEFSESQQSPELATRLAQVTVRHAKKGVLSRWELSRSLGYGAFSLFDPKNEDKHEHSVVAFNAKMQPADAPHAAWLFVSGLGQSDWYSGREGAREAPVLGDVMWAFVRCKK